MPRCGHVLRRARRDLIDRTLALCLAGLMLYAVAVAFPFLDFIVGGRTWTMSLPTLPGSLEAYGLWQLALVMVVTTLVAPLAKLGLTLAVLLGVQARHMPPWVPAAVRLREHVSPC